MGDGLGLDGLQLDEFQREMLAALGHEVLVLATGSPGAGAESTQAIDAAGMPALQQALLRAVGGDAARLAGLPPLDLLRTPAAKRALWPRLRAARRQARP